MAFTKKQKAAVKSIISCHETGKPVGNYSALVVLADDAGITFGCHQATHKSGSLHKIVQMYCNISNSATSKGLDAYVAGLKNPSLRHKYAKDTKLKSLLKESGKEAAMRYSQDRVFEVNYFDPAVRAVEGSGWVTPLALAVVYDSMIQGGWTTVRDRVSGKKNEKEWIKAFVAARRKWLSGSSRKVVRNSVYRMKTFENLIANDNWDLNIPMIVHGVKITNDHLAVWMLSDNPSATIATAEVDSEFIDVQEPIPSFFAGNTEGLAEDDGATLPDDEEDDITVTPVEELEDTDLSGVVDGDREIPDSGESGDTGNPPKAGEPVPDAPAQEGEAIVGGRPQDPPIIVQQPTEDKPSGWRTWPTTITATLGSLGLSVGGIATQVTEMEFSPTTQSTIGWVIIAGIASAVAYGLFYLVSRAVATNAEKARNHQLALKELELRSMPDRYNVKLDRRGDTSNLADSGLPMVATFKRQEDAPLQSPEVTTGVFRG